MKKYRVTEKHPAYKDGCIIMKSVETVERDIGTQDLYNLICNGVFINHVLGMPIFENIENGWIEEIQEPEFTEEDMEKAFWSGHNTELTFDEWINNYKNEKQTN